MVDNLDSLDGEDLTTLRSMRQNLESDLACQALETESLNEKQSNLERNAKADSVRISDCMEKLKKVQEDTKKCSDDNNRIDGYMETLPKQEQDACTITDNFLCNDDIRNSILSKLNECMNKKSELLRNKEAEVTRTVSDAQVEMDSIKEQEMKSTLSLRSKLKLIESQTHSLEGDLAQIQLENEELTKICDDLIVQSG